MAKAAHCALCGKNVYVTEDGACPNGHSSEFLSNFYDVPDEPAAPAPTPDPVSTPVPVAPSAPRPGIPEPSMAPPIPPIPVSAPPSGSLTAGAPNIPAPPNNISPGVPMGAAPPKKKSKTGLIIGIIVVVLLCCIGSVVATVVGGVNFFEKAVDDMSTTSIGEPGVPGMSTGTVRVELQWDEPIDMDLEIWNATGDEALTSAGMENYDSLDGLDSGEYIDFKNLADLDLSQGDYIVSVYFADGDDQIPSANVELVVTKPDGSTEARTGVVYWEIGMDQWHAFSINAETGAITDMNEYIDIEVTE